MTALMPKKSASDVSATTSEFAENIEVYKNIPTSDWLLIPATLVAAYITARILFTFIVHPVLKFISKKTKVKFDNLFIRSSGRAVKFFLFVVVLDITVPFIPSSDTSHTVFDQLVVFFYTFGGVWLAFNAIDTIIEMQITKLKRQDKSSSANVMPLFRKFLKITIVVIFITSLLQSMGVNVGAILAGLGIGGIAIALAGQKTIENLFGGIVLILDQPVKVGDYLNVDTLAGTVEEIGLRSTRIRTLDRTVITVPNSEMAQMRIENFAKRERIRLNATIGVRYETTPDQMRHLLISLKKMLVAHPKVDSDPVRARFIGFGAYSLDIQLYAYILTNKYKEFLAIREDILLRVMDIVDKSGTSFAFPSQTIYTTQDAPWDTKTQQAVEKEVAKWRKSDDLLLPVFPDSVKAELDDTLDYPPKGSAITKGDESGES